MLSCSPPTAPSRSAPVRRLGRSASRSSSVNIRAALARSPTMRNRRQSASSVKASSAGRRLPRPDWRIVVSVVEQRVTWLAATADATGRMGHDRDSCRETGALRMDVRTRVERVATGWADAPLGALQPRLRDAAAPRVGFADPCGGNAVRSRHVATS